MKKYNFLSMTVLMLALTGCSSEVDKCVDAYLKWYDLQYQNEPKSERAKFEAMSRANCLEKQAGNK